ncbi:ubiquitin-conjugating enzyme E2 25 [Hirschfeldia incana]|nr:ubiquitin-conjugating enzyme E2 25 [Hirschfeldia incana]
MEPEIAHPVASCSITLTPNKATTPDVNNGVEEELYEMQNGGVVSNNNNNVDSKNKGKAIQWDPQSDDDDLLEGPANDGSSPPSDSLLDPDSLIYEEEDDDDYDYSDHYAYEMEDDHADDYVSEYQALFDAKEKEIPAGVEVAMDWLPDKPSGSSKPEATSSSSSLKKSTIKSGIHLSPDTTYAILPHKTLGFQYAGQGLKYPSIHLGPKTPGAVTGEAVPAPGPFSSASALQKIKKQAYLGLASTRPLVEEVISAPNTSTVKRNMEDYLGKYLFFKKFDIVEDLGDHHYAAKGAASKQQSKEWAKRIQEEWRILENDLPEMIFVRAYESRMDLLRAVIVGADGTPYHDGLFFFDIFFPDAYPSVPPVSPIKRLKLNFCCHLLSFFYGFFFVITKDGSLPLWWSKNQPESVQLWESVFESSRHLEWCSDGEVDPQRVYNATGSSLNPSTNLESETLLQRTWLRENGGFSRRGEPIQSLQRADILTFSEDDGLQHEKTTQVF